MTDSTISVWTSTVQWLPRVILLAVAVAVANSRSACAGDIIYTWQDDSHSGASGFLEIDSAAQAAGQFTRADVVDFNFYAGTTFGLGSLGFVPSTVPISTENAGFTSPTSLLYAGNAFAAITIDINSNYSITNGENFTVFGDVSPFPNSGTGHWVISGAVTGVPEPTSFVPAGFAVLAGLAAWRWRIARC